MLVGIVALGAAAVLGLLAAERLRQGLEIPRTLSVLLGVSLAPGLACAWFAWRVYKTAATVELHDSGVELWDTRRTFCLRRVGWPEISGFRDGESDFVSLDAKSGRIHVPTRSEKELVALLALLDGRGLRRIE